MKPRDAETSLEREFDQHFDLPTIRSVTPRRPFAWLALGVRDMRANLVESLVYGTVVAIAGWLIWAYTKDRPQLFTTSVTSFFLIAPLLAAGLYEISRRQERNIHTSFGESLQAWRASGGALVHFGLALVLWAIFWERISAILFALSYQVRHQTCGASFVTSSCRAITRKSWLPIWQSAPCSPPSCSWSARSRFRCCSIATATSIPQWPPASSPSRATSPP